MIRTAGGIVLGDHGTLALVRSVNSGSWLFPKGKIEEGESDEEAARREIAEETGITDLEYLDDLGSYIRPHAVQEGGVFDFEEKEVRMFLYAAPAGATFGTCDEIIESRWFSLKEVPEVLGTPHIEWFARDRAWFTTVFERVRQAIQRD